ncbi:hypothetical protein EVA_18199 [gut metagenome]|uniref:Uncharacterized protein n=1 Tax=gut metagenome TaxID=749906 RepID=J9C1K3_9ZZZZ
MLLFAHGSLFPEGGSFSFSWIQDTLADSKTGRGYLKEFVLVNKFNGLFQT